MPYFNVHIDECDMLSEISTETLVKELKERKDNVYGGPLSDKSHKRYLLNEVADFLRKNNKGNLAGWVEDLREELEL